MLEVSPEVQESVNEALNAAQRGHFQSAMDTLDAYLNAGDRFNEAFAAMERREWDAAIEGFRASATLNDRNAPCHGNIGLCLAQLGRKADALAELDRALEIDPDYQPARSNRRIVMEMSEGRPLEGVRYESVNFARDEFEKMEG